MSRRAKHAMPLSARSSLLALVAILTCAALGTPSAWAAAGDIDTTFGSANGLMTTDFGRGPSMANDAVLQPDGKIVVAGQDTGRGTEFAVARYNADGSLDQTFSTDGQQTTFFRSGRAVAIARQPDG